MAPADWGRFGVSAGGAAVASSASSGACISWWIASAISSRPRSEGLRWCDGGLEGPTRPGAGFSTKRVTRTWLPLGTLDGLPFPLPAPSLPSVEAASPFSLLFVPPLPENHATLFQRPEESPLPDREWPAPPLGVLRDPPLCESPLSDMTAKDTRTICSSPRYTCVNTRSTLREMFS